ncbi:MAG: xanthine dehydrogenase molybdenum-binding subunit XdhA [Campylobacteraceae bacterium]|nr:xanthine dehydrogenase molybdenum-binding subunit XdhA [Campylobacteraceae bacterium]
MQNKNEVVGQSVIRWDAYAKVTGRADYTDDIPSRKKYHAKLVRGKIAHGFVKSMDFTEALKVKGVVKVVTPDDLPSTKFSTAGHPFNIGEKHDRYDRQILTKHIRLYGDPIAAIIAEDQLAATIAAEKVKVEYEELPFYLQPEDAMVEGAAIIHEDLDSNIMAHATMNHGDIDKSLAEADHIFEEEFYVPQQQHSHMEPHVACAYQGSDKRWVCVSSTQIPHITRRVLGEVFDMPWSQFRVIKPFIGGGFGNKQDVVLEPIVMALSMAMDGKPVQIYHTREESLAYTRCRHSMKYKAKIGVSKDGYLQGLDLTVYSNKGAYASHTVAVGMKGGGMLLSLYKIPSMRYDIYTVYTNTAVSGAMRAYGIPQVTFMIESFMEDIAKKMGFDPFEFREKNLVKKGDKNPLNGVSMDTIMPREILAKGRAEFNYDAKLKAAHEFQNRDKKRGVAFAALAYNTSVWPHGIEIAGARLILNQDGRIKLMLGATEIGQGSDTVFSQMAAETVGVPYEWVFTDALTDTDTAPFDTGSYASRQSFVTGQAVKKAAQDLRTKILEATCKFNEGIKADELDVVQGEVVKKSNGEVVMSLNDLAIYSTYDWDMSKQLSRAGSLVGEASVTVHKNAYCHGATFAEVEVDIKTGRIDILSIMNVHDSGRILNPLQATGQVEGALGMSIPYAMGEELRYDAKTGKPLNNNLLDYKMPTAMDLPDLDCVFMDNYDDLGPFGNKSLGENPMCATAPAIRNAVYDAIGIKFNKLPIKPEDIITALKEKK